MPGPVWDTVPKRKIPGLAIYQTLVKYLKTTGLRSLLFAFLFYSVWRFCGHTGLPCLSLFLAAVLHSSIWIKTTSSFLPHPTATFPVGFLPLKVPSSISFRREDQPSSLCSQRTVVSSCVKTVESVTSS